MSAVQEVARPLSIAATAEKFRLTHRALRFYEQRGLLTPERNGAARIYGADDLERITTITKLKAFGYSLGEIAVLVENPGDGPFGLDAENCERQIAFLEERLASVTAAISELQSRLSATS